MQFRCPKCKTLLQIATRPANGLIGCPGCNGTIRLPAAGPALPKTPSVPVPQRNPQAAKPSAQRRSPARPNTARPTARPQPTFDPLASLPPSTGINYGGLQTPAYLQPAQQTAPSRSQPTGRKKGGGALKVIGIILAVGGGFLMLSCAGLVILGLLAKNGVFVRTATATYAGYSVDAPGIDMGAKTQQQTTGVTIFNRSTGSEFMIAEVKSPLGKPTPELFLSGLSTRTKISSQSTISRAGLTGVRYETEGSRAAPAHIGEAYATAEGILLLMYVSGPDLAEFSGKPPKMDTDTAISRDKPDAFFASLRPAGK